MQPAKVTPFQTDDVAGAHRLVEGVAGAQGGLLLRLVEGVGDGVHVLAQVTGLQTQLLAGQGPAHR